MELTPIEAAQLRRAVRIAARGHLYTDNAGLVDVTGVRTATLGSVVTKSGRATGVTRGEVTAVDGVAQLTYAGVACTITGVLTIEAARPYDEVSAPGDSGSLWCDVASMAAVGLHAGVDGRPSP